MLCMSIILVCQDVKTKKEAIQINTGIKTCGLCSVLECHDDW